MGYRLQITDIAKHFDRHLLFKNINCTVEQGQLLTISGENGSGKSTLLRIIAGLLTPSQGSIGYYQDSQAIDAVRLRTQVGMAAPACNLYDELTAYENLLFLARLRGNIQPHDKIESLLEFMGLLKFRHEPYGIFSTGMKQRLKIAAAVLDEPAFLLLDEPFSNLDSKGREIVAHLIDEQRTRGCVIIASNIKDDIDRGDVRIELS